MRRLQARPVGSSGEGVPVFVLDRKGAPFHLSMAWGDLSASGAEEGEELEIIGEDGLIETVLVRSVRDRFGRQKSLDVSLVTEPEPEKESRVEVEVGGETHLAWLASAGASFLVSDGVEVDVGDEIVVGGVPRYVTHIRESRECIAVSFGDPPGVQETPQFLLDLLAGQNEEFEES